MPDKEETSSVSESENPAIPSPTPASHRPRTNQDWWPNQLDLSVLHAHSPQGNPMDPDFDYSKEVETLDFDYPYDHVRPFSLREQEASQVDRAFEAVFGRAARWLEAA